MAGQEGGPQIKPRGRKATSSGRRNVMLIDMDTGEPLDGVPLLVPRKQGIGDWAMIMLVRLGELAADREITGETWRVLAYVMAQAEWENWVRLSQADVGKVLGLKRQSVQRAMRTLVAKRVIEKSGTTIGGNNVYRICKDVSWRGKMTSYRKAKQGEKPPHLKIIDGGKDMAKLDQPKEG
ncbi:MAG: hypothetical protein JWP57_4682 [Spirosoma sp.]|nr:hypothetical protein [Spirosoma sp.]